MDTTDQTPAITYVVGAGPYPYRADGRRMSQTEATSYLIESYGMHYGAAVRLLDMTTTQAVRDAGEPMVERLTRTFGADFSIDGSDPQSRPDTVRKLVLDWRMTPGEAAAVLDRAPEAVA